MFTSKRKNKQALGRMVHKNTQCRTRVNTKNLKQEGNRITKKKQVQERVKSDDGSLYILSVKQVHERVKSNDGSLYIKRLEPADSLNAQLTHRLHYLFES